MDSESNIAHLSPPQRLLLVNTNERKKREAGALEREIAHYKKDPWSAQSKKIKQ